MSGSSKRVDSAAPEGWPLNISHKDIEAFMDAFRDPVNDRATALMSRIPGAANKHLRASLDALTEEMDMNDVPIFFVVNHLLGAMCEDLGNNLPPGDRIDLMRVRAEVNDIMWDQADRLAAFQLITENGSATPSQDHTPVSTDPHSDPKEKP